MTPKGATGRSGACFYYECTRQIHQQSRAECSSPRIPAVALEDAVKGLIRRIATLPQAREQIVRQALEALGGDAAKIKEEAGLVRNRLAAVSGEINNLVNSLAKLGADAADLVKEGLTRLKGERDQLQGQLKELDAAKAPHDVVREQAAKFVTGWTDVGQLLDDADLAEQRVILQHLVHSLVLTAADKGAKHGTYALRLFPEIGPINPDEGENDRGPNPNAPRKGPGDRAVLTENDVVRQFGEKAPQAALNTIHGFVELGAFRINRLQRPTTVELFPWNDPPTVPKPSPKSANSTRDPLVIARYYQSLMDSGKFEKRAALARFLGVSRARVTQVLNRLKKTSHSPTPKAANSDDPEAEAD